MRGQDGEGWDTDGACETPGGKTQHRYIPVVAMSVLYMYMGFISTSIIQCHAIYKGVACSDNEYTRTTSLVTAFP